MEPNFVRLKALKRDLFSTNFLRNIQLQVGKLQSLILLDVEHNQLVSVPEELSQCTQLGPTFFTLAWNWFSKVYLYLEYLEFAHNKIRFFPESIILKCERIRYLGFNNNLFAHIPPSSACYSYCGEIVLDFV